MKLVFSHLNPCINSIIHINLSVSPGGYDESIKNKIFKILIARHLKFSNFWAVFLNIIK